jgi:hypothetical protein
VKSRANTLNKINRKEGKIMKNKVVGEGEKFERIRRVTGYLSGDVSRFNNGKRAEEKDRVKHTGVKELIEFVNDKSEDKKAA